VRESERIELEAYRDSFEAAPPGFPVTVRRTGSAVALAAPAAPLMELNRIVGLSSLEELDELEPVYEGGRVVVSLDPEAGLDEELVARGYRPGYAWQKFERGLEPYEARTELQIADAPAAGEFGPVVAAAFGAPPPVGTWLDALVGRLGWHVLVAYDGDRPVGGGALFTSGRTGWLGIAGTLPEARGRGAQGAVFAARIERARELGLDLLVTETGLPREERPGPSYRNMLRVGFEPTYVRPNYVLRAE
jgi:GNAT superfamily N-acetyltransferase